MKFEIGKYYQHTSGTIMNIIGPVKTFFYGDGLLSESDDGSLMAVGQSEDATINWHKVPGWAREVED